jgi:NAD(P)-dependent dehydrogenase (short-subunit alcohol dehydrogenase family)
MGIALDLNRRAYLVCGAGGGGIGTAIAVMLAQAGATVIAIDNTEAGRQTVAQALGELGSHHLVVDCDLTDVAAVEAMLAQATQSAGAIRGAVTGPR